MAAGLALLASVAGCSGASTDPVQPSVVTAVDSAPPSLNLGDGKFERVGETDGVTVFERRDASLISVGAQGPLPAPPETVLAALLDYSRHAEVLERLAECRVLERGDDWLVVYQRLGLPVIDDRDFTLRLNWGHDAERHWIRYRAVPEGPPPVDGVIRVTRHFGGWDLLPADGGKTTRARYQSNIDMAGAVPLWMTRSGAADELPALFRSMCSLLPKPYSDRCPA
ncbi:MAG: SRPBCC family protein [Deltaproteobacteria bacterium]|jgi:hypothetical protein|nr:SRPBCC family protein [Deltaproteobacteria bacterium]MBW2530666.1 SRPBCC family protein [Deltaproteobacteria bacterium]